jgi:DNA-binding NarL/FixJ family response regulator
MTNRVLIADDHDIVRRGIRSLIEEQADMEVAGEAATAPEVLDSVREESWDLLILDLNMPGGEGLETLTRIRTAAPDLPVIILSVHPEDQLAARLLKAGARGYVQKEAASRELIVAARRVLDGERYVSPDLASRLASSLAGEATADPHEALSDREFQVLRLLGEGLSVGDIADELSLSVKTVSTYKSRLLSKMEMETAAELIRYAMEHDLVE